MACIRKRRGKYVVDYRDGGGDPPLGDVRHAS